MMKSDLLTNHVVEHTALRTQHVPGKIGIYRAFNSERGGHYLHVSLKRNGKIFQKYFSEKRCGGEDQTMRLAQAWRDKVIAQHPPMSKKQFCSIVRSNNTSGVAGVSRIIKRSRCKNGNESILVYWQARIPLPDGTLTIRNFSVFRLGDENPKKFAIETRTSALNELVCVAFRTRHQPHAVSTSADMEVLDAAQRVSADKKLKRYGERAAKLNQDAARISAQSSLALAAEQVALSTRTNRSGEPYIGRYKMPTALSYYWMVGVIRQGTRHRKSFADSKYGGEVKSLRAAKAWRDELFAALPVESKGQVVSRVKATNTSGVAGVTRVRVMRKGQSFQYWVAHSPMVKGQPKRTKGYSIEKHGETEALALASKARENYVKELGEVDFVQHRAARQMRNILKLASTHGTGVAHDGPK